MALTTITADRDSYFSTQSVRIQFNNLLKLVRYFDLNRLASTTTATQPACAIATVTSQVKTTNATVLWCNGVAVALGASDNYWTLTGGTLAASSFRKYLLCSNASGTASVVVSTDAAAAASCLFTSIPADGVAIVGQLTVSTDASHTFIAGTTLLGAAGITTAFIDNHDDSLLASFANLIAP